MTEDAKHNKDLAGKSTWDSWWNNDDLPSPVNPDDTGYNNTVALRFHDYFTQLFDDMDTRSMKLLEIGAARSTWLPYFSKQFNFDVVGLDYSEIGCKQTESIFRKSGVDGKMVHADMYDPPIDMIESFDVVFTIGVIEHFTKTFEAVKAIKKFVKPNGLIITEIPNMVGSLGWLQKLIDPDTFHIHVPIGREQLREVHLQAGLEVLDCNYFMFIHYGVANMHKASPNAATYKLKHFFHVQLQRFSKAVWVVENTIQELPTNRITSPYVVCLARKPT